MNLSYALWLAVSGVISVFVALAAWRRRRDSPAALPFVVLTLALAFWAFTYAVSWMVPRTETAVFWLKLTTLGVIGAPCAFFVMTLRFLGISLNGRAYGALLAIPALSVLLLWTDPWHHLFFGNFPLVGRGSIFHGGPWFYIHLVYLNALIAAGVFLLLRAYARSPKFYRPQIALILAGAFAPWGANLYLALRSYPAASLDWTPVAFAFTGILFAYALFGFRLMDLTPVARDVLVENLDEAIVVVDTQGRIVDMNPKAMELADPGLELPFGKPMREVFSRWSDVIAAYAVFEGRAEVKLDRGPYSDVNLSVIPLKDRLGTPLGKLVTWRDISARKQAEERLRVFFRAVEQNPSAILITNPQGGIEYVNPQFVRLTGYALGEVRGKTPRILKSGEMQEGVYENLWQTITAGLVWEGEVLNRKKSGDLYWAYELIAPVLNEKGVVTHFIAMQQDITERKSVEAELRVVNARLQAQLVEIESLHQQLREEAIHDGLTRLYNRRYMEEMLDHEMSRAERERRPLSAVMMDVDRFKTINDTYGHQAGDAVLQTLGAMLLENTRVSDIACRYGGDEMLVVMPGADIGIAAARAEEWRATFSQMTFHFGREKIGTTLSLGVASFPEQARSANELLMAADKALYRAKVKRNRVVRYDPSQMAHDRHRSDGIR